MPEITYLSHVFQSKFEIKIDEGKSPEFLRNVVKTRRNE
jgi:hypothetical protein